MISLVGKVRKSRRSWARNEGAVFAIKRVMEARPNLKVTLLNFVDESFCSSSRGRPMNVIVMRMNSS